MKTLLKISALLLIALFGCGKDGNPVTSTPPVNNVLLSRTLLDSASEEHNFLIGHIDVPNVDSLYIRFKMESNYQAGAAPLFLFPLQDSLYATIYTPGLYYVDSLRNKQIDVPIYLPQYKGKKVFVNFSVMNLQAGLWYKIYDFSIKTY